VVCSCCAFVCDCDDGDTHKETTAKATTGGVQWVGGGRVAAGGAGEMETQTRVITQPQVRAN